MQRADLLRLDAAAALTPAELDDDLAETVRTVAADRLRETVAERFNGAPPELRDAVERLRVEPTGDRLLGEEVVNELRADGIAGTLLEEAEVRVGRLAGEPADAALAPDVPLRANPLLAESLARAHWERVGALAGVAPDKTEAVFAAGANAGNVDDAVLEQLVGAGQLDGMEARELGFAATLVRLLDGDVALAERLHADLNSIPDGRLGAVRRLVSLSSDQWQARLDAAGPLPDGLDSAQYGRLLTARLETAFPTDSLAERLASRDALGLQGELEAVQPLLDANERVFGDAPPSFDAVAADERERVERSYQTLRRLVDGNPGLGLGALLDDVALPPAERLARAQARIGLLPRLAELNPATELLELDLSVAGDGLDQIDFGDLSDDERSAVTENLKAYQRARALTGDLSDAQAVLAAGYDAASSVAAEPLDAFVERTGLPVSSAAAYYQEARSAAEAVAGAVGAVLEAAGTGFDSLAVGNLAPSTREFFRRIDGYDDLFSEHDYCRCEECASLLSPAAYFVDLMRFVEANLLDRAFAGPAANDPLSLRLRRPDLWTLELTCANTEYELPLLEIVDRLLEDHIARHTGFTGSLTDRAAVWRHVYRDRVATAADSFAQPVLLPLERVEVYLAHFGPTRGEIARLVGTGDDAAAATLRLSRREWELVTQADATRGFLERIYGAELPFGGTGTLYRIEAQALLRAIAIAPRKDAVRPEPADERETAITRDDLATLLATRFVGQLRIQGERRGPDSIQNDIEWVYGPTADSLDRLHRFVRLWRALEWSPGELDLVLAHLEAAGLAVGIDAAALRRICRLLELCRRFTVPVEELVPLFHLVPTTAVPPQTASLFDRRFNPAGLVDVGGRLPRDDVELVHPALRDDPAAPSAADWALVRLLAGLAVGADGLLELIRGLAAPLGLTLAPGAPEADRGFALSQANLSLLYRHARLADWLQLSVPALFRLAELTPGVTQGYVATFDELLALLDFHGRLADRPGGVAADDAQPNSGQVAAAIADRVERDGSLIFADTLLAELDGVSGADSRAVVAANAPARVTALGEGRYRLADTFDPGSAMTIPGGVTVNEPAARALLTAHHASRIVPPLLAAQLGIDEAKASALLGLAGVALVDADLARALRRAYPASPTALERLAAATIPLASLFAADGLDADAVAFAEDHRDVFALDPANIDGEATARVESYRQLANAANAADLRAVLAGFDAAAGFASGTQAPLLRVLGVEAAVSRSLQAYVALPASALAAVERLRTAAELATRLGIDGQTLALIAAEDYDSLDTAAAGLLAAFRAKYPNDAEWRERSEPFEGRILGRRRDGLADFLVFSGDVPLRPLHRLFNAATRDRLYTTSDDERNSVTGQGDYVPEGDACWIYATAQPGSVPLHRLAGQEDDGSIVHFYTTSDDERDRYIDMLPYHSEGEAGWVYAAPQPGTRPLHHLTTNDGRHLYTTSDAERDAAVARYGYLAQAEACWVPPTPFRTREDLSRYFLIDVEVDGCFPTSPVVAAIGSLQLYVHRVLMNLEQDEDGNLSVRPDWVPADEWRWREHFRVWQAGRRVFLQTENYLAPDVRDDKTPLFEELEDALLQNDIDEQAVLDAYGRYLAGFQELAGLAVAGAYHDIDRVNKRDVLHLIGVTAADPPSFYYRAVENAYHGGLINSSAGTVWGPWRAMNVQIPARKVAPVVHLGRLHVFWVEITTSPQNEISDGKSRFIGYTHRLAVKFSTLRLDGNWTAPQRVSLYGVPPFEESDGVLDDPLAEPSELDAFNVLTALLPGFGTFSLRELIRQNPQFGQFFMCLVPRYERTQPVADAIHFKARDGYTLRGSEWEQVYPESSGDQLLCVGAGYEMRATLDLFGRRALAADGVLLTGTRLRTTRNPTPPDPLLCISRYQIEEGWYLRYLSPTQQIAFFDDYALANVIGDYERAARLFSGTPWVATFDQAQQAGPALALLPEGYGSLAPVNGSLIDAILELPAVRPAPGGYGIDYAAPGQLYLLQASVRDGSRWLVRRLGTALAETLALTLFTRGVDGLLDLDTQRSLMEPAITGTVPPAAPVTLRWQPDAPVDDAVVAGRIDFTGPLGSYFREIFLHIPLLIARQLHGQGRYAEAQRWYNKLFDPTAREVVSDDPGLSTAENAARRRDRVWRYVEFRGLNAATMQRILTDRQALEAYRRDPFNAHAIARVRLSAYQKAIVIGYVRLLLDWADFLFGQFEQETLNEATMLYETAADILGDRPAELGECGAPDPQPRTYERFRERLRKGSPFLTELEQWIWVQNGPKGKKQPAFTLDPGSAASAATRTAALPSLRAVGVTAADGLDGAGGVATPDWNLAGRAAGSRSTSNGGEWLAARGFELPGSGRDPTGSGVGYTLVRQISPGFCAPPNRELLGLWDSVEDRLWKLRHCRDITGARRDLSLFAPEIPLDLLQRARQEGLSPEDVLGSMAGEVPPYRFTFLVAKAREHAAAVQALGTALLEALGRRDAGELDDLRAVHEQQLLTLTTSVRRWQHDAAEATLESLQRRRTGVDNRRAYFQALIDTGLRPEELAQRLSQYAALTSQTVEAGLSIAAGVVHLLANVGAPTAITYGGKQVGDSLDSFAGVARATGAQQSTLGATASMEAGFTRRDQEWRQQLQAAQDELADLDQQIAAAELQRDIAGRETELHERTLTQNAELRDFYRDRFTSVELYRWQSQQLLTLHRESYGAAHALTRMALRSYRFERDDPAADVLSRNPWEPGRAGLLAGAKLANELATLERRFLETDTRQLEIQQSFSLELMNPAALIRLKQTGECEFTIPEFLFDLAYRGHYRRRIRQVALTIPAVCGPFAAVSARLELLGSQIRRDPDAPLAEVALAGTVVIATSRGQSDGGAFELSFRDDRLAAFEGAGAVESRWRLTMPQSVREWDYQSMSDVVVQLAYTARDDETLRGRTEAAIAGQLAGRRLARAFSLAREFSPQFNRLMSSPAGTVIRLELASKHLPFYLGRREPSVRAARLVARPAEGRSLGSLKVTLNGRSLPTFAPNAQLGGLPSADARAALAGGLLRQHELSITNAGALADLVLFVEYDVPAAEPAPAAGERPDELATLREQADAGDAAAAYQLGLLLWRERGDPEGAIAPLDQGARGGDPGAMRDLGLLLRERGDLDGAIYWLRRGADNGAEGAAEALADAERRRDAGSGPQ